jgi:hypothetical protein
MRHLPALVLLLALPLHLLVAAPAPREVAFVLQDKTTVRGTIVSFQQDVYEVATQSLGVVKIPAGSIVRIDYAPDSAPAATATASPAPAATAATPTAATAPGLGDKDRLSALFSFESILKTIMGDPQALAKVEQLANDPAFAAVLDDPEITKAIEDGNFVSLATNKKILALMEHPVVKELSQGLKAQPPATDDEE